MSGRAHSVDMTQNPLESTYRPIRRIAPPDVPIAGVLAAEGENTVLLVDVDAVPAPWWRDDPAAHLLAPVDVARRADGHDAVLPWCVVTVGSYLRARTDEPLSGGEGVTLAVSLMRGCAEAALPARFGDDPVPVPHGRWWLTDQGRPLFAVGEGTPAREETAELLALLAGACADRVVARLATEAADSIRVRSPVGVLVRLEESMFEACAPRPLLVRVTDPVTLHPLGAQELRPHSDRGGGAAAPRFIGAEPAQRARLRSAAGWRDRARSAWAGLLRVEERRSLRVGERRAATDRHPRRMPLLIGASLAAAILAAGLLWPQPDGDVSSSTLGPNAPTVPREDVDASPSSAVPQATAPAAATGEQGQRGGQDLQDSPPSAQDPSSADGSGTEGTEPVLATPAPEEGPASASPRDAEVIAATADLLAAVAGCREQQTCGPLLADGVDPERIPRGGAIELIEDFGGVVVLRVVTDGATTNLISIERVDGAWRVRGATTITGGG